jgi:hypothetical protein
MPDEPEQDAAPAEAARERSPEAGAQPEAGGEADSGGEHQQSSALSAAMGSTRTAQLASLAEQADLRGLEKALDQIEAERNAQVGLEAAALARAAGVPVRDTTPSSVLACHAVSACHAVIVTGMREDPHRQRWPCEGMPCRPARHLQKLRCARHVCRGQGQGNHKQYKGDAARQVEASPRDMRRVMMRGRKVAAWKRLSLSERDVLTVLSAICKARAAFLGPLLLLVLGAESHS